MFPNLLNQFDTMKKLNENHNVTCSYTNVEIRLVPNLFESFTLYIDEKEYIITNNEEPNCFFNEVVKALLKVLIEEEKYIIFHKAMNMESIKTYGGFKEFLKENTYSSNWIEGYVEIEPVFYDEISEDFFTIEELYEMKLEEMYNLTFGLNFDYQNQHYFLENWLNSPDRVRIMMNMISNPNEDIQGILLEFFTQEEAMKTAGNHSLVNDFYSDYQRNSVAFDVKVYEEFAHPDLMEWEIINYEEESQNRTQAIHSLIEEIKNDEELTEMELYSWEMEGKSGGYLVIEFGDVTPKEMEKVIEIIELAKENSWKDYQLLEHYRYMWETIVDKLEDLKEYAEEEDVEKMQKIIDEIHQKNKERV